MIPNIVVHIFRNKYPFQKAPTSPHLRDLLLRLANLESVAARGRAVVAAFTEATEAAEKSVARGEAAAEAELAKHRAQVEEQEVDIVSYTQYGLPKTIHIILYAPTDTQTNSHIEIT